MAEQPFPEQPPVVDLPDRSTGNRQKKWLLPRIIGVAVVALVVGAIFVFPKLFGQSTQPATTAESSQDGGLIVENEPDLDQSFRYGLKESWEWKTSNSTIDSVSVLGITDTEVTVYQNGPDIAGSSATRLDVDSATELGYGGYECFDKLFDGHIVCHAYHGVDDVGSYYVINPQTGESDFSLGFDQIGLPKPQSYNVAHGIVRMSDEGLVVYAGSSTCANQSSCPGKLALFDKIGHMKWVTDVSFSDDLLAFTSADGLGALRDSSLASPSNTESLIFDLNTGSVSHGFLDPCLNAEVYPGRVVYCERDSARANLTMKVELDGAQPFTVVGADAVAPSFIRGRPDAPIIIGDLTRMTSEGPFSQLSMLQTPAASEEGQQTAAKWTVNLPFSNPILASWNGADLVAVTDTQGNIGVVNIASGTLVSSMFYANLGPASDYELPFVDFIDKYTLMVDSAQGVGATGFFDAQTGQLMYTNAKIDPQRHGYAVGDGYVIMGMDDGSAVVRFEPGTVAEMDAGAAPVSMPSCPQGMVPISFATYSAGSVLVCGGSVGYSVQATIDGKDLAATKLRFIDGGVYVDFNGGSWARITLGGAWIGTDSGQFPAIDGYYYRYGTADTKVTAGVTDLQCPADSWPISMSTWNGGWLLVCGTAMTSPTALVFSDPQFGQGQALDATYSDGSYCGKSGAVEVCAYGSPASVSFTSGGDRTQRDVSDNFFGNVGSGGTGKGTGGYNVPVPQGTAADQVRYIVDILNASAKTRADLLPVLNDLNHDIAGPAQIAALESVAESRKTQREEVLKAPVTQIEGGEAMMTTLAQALQVSENTNRAYIQWAKAIQRGDQAAKDAEIAKWRPQAAESERLKQQFVNTWNAVIVPQYGVQSFQASQI